MKNVSKILNFFKFSICDFLDIPQEQRNELNKMLSKCKKVDKDIEVNIVKLGLLDREVSRDERIRKNIIDKISPLDREKALLPNELQIHTILFLWYLYSNK